MTHKQNFIIREREEKLKDKWQGVADNVPVNGSQYSFDSAEREQAFVNAQFPTEEERKRYQAYREEWYRRAKEFDAGDAPLAVCCELVSTCNLGCSMCYTITDEFQDSVVGATRMLPWEVVTRVIDECAELDIPSILFSWRGESTIYRQRRGDKVYTIADVLAYARKKGILEITTLTHGQKLSGELAEQIIEAEPSWISVSIDGLDDVYNKIRTPPSKADSDYDAFKTVVRNIQNLISLRDAKGQTRPQIRTNSIFPAIAADPQKYHDFMEELGVGWVTVNELLDFREDEIPDEDIIQDWACQYPFQRLTVSANGVILPCTGAHNEEEALVLGRYTGAPRKSVKLADGSTAIKNHPEMTLGQAWHSQKLEQIRATHKSNQRTCISPGCKHCRHGAKKHGVEWIPDEWNMDTMEWEGGVWRE
jgi:sulfatase maturation enzyme AslB (radical SAM superfamily)